MTKIDILSGFLGAGKTTLIKKLLSEALTGEKVVLIENEFGEIGIDGGFLKDAGIEVTEMNSGCICCSLVGDFGAALRKVIEQYTPDRILIEPSGVGKLSDVIRAVEGVARDLPVTLNSFVTVADASKTRMYVRNFGEFYLNQIESACAILLTRTAEISEDKLNAAVALLREHNPKARIVTTPWNELTGAQILSAMESAHSLADEMLAELIAQPHEQHHHHHDHEHAHEHDHGHEEHHHEHGEDCTCGCHDHEHARTHHHDPAEHEHDHTQHHHEHGEGCTCGCHDHDHHHDADEVFTSWGAETPHKYSRDELTHILEQLDSAECGMVLRAKGIVPCTEGGWLNFDYVPGEGEVRDGAADYTGRLCVIGSNLNEAHIKSLFRLG
ncbi:MAG: GTP-binding protein [Clostridia bacterium]|nr:GTP-binding protein [Clostridia bacterium]